MQHLATKREMVASACAAQYALPFWAHNFDAKIVEFEAFVVLSLACHDSSFQDLLRSSKIVCADKTESLDLFPVRLSSGHRRFDRIVEIDSMGFN